MAFYNGVREIPIQASGKTALLKGKENSSGAMGAGTPVYGSITRCKGTDSTRGLTDANTLANTSKTKRAGRVSMCGPVVSNTMVRG